MGQFIELSAEDGTRFKAYESRPRGRVRGGVVVLQEIFGVNAHIRNVADGYAEQGYVAVAPATFARVRADVELGYTQDDMAAGFALKQAVEALPAPGVMHDIAAAVAHARTAGGGKVGVVGYCWGGLLTWRAAALVPGIAAAVPYYGGGMTAPGEAERVPACPVLAHFGDQDHWIPNDTVDAFARLHSGRAVQVHVYAAHHGFNCDHRASHDPAAAGLARDRTLAFFAQHVG